MPAQATVPQLTQKWILVCTQMCMGFAPARELPPHLPSPLTFRSISRTHLSTRWLVQTTGSMFCVSHRARRSWRAWWGGGECQVGVQGAPRGHVVLAETLVCRGEEGSGWAMQGCYSLAFHCGNQGEAPCRGWRKPGSRGGMSGAVGLGETHGSCLLSLYMPAPAPIARQEVSTQCMFVEGHPTTRPFHVGPSSFWGQPVSPWYKTSPMTTCRGQPPWGPGSCGGWVLLQVPPAQSPAACPDQP